LSIFVILPVLERNLQTLTDA